MTPLDPPAPPETPETPPPPPPPAPERRLTRSTSDKMLAGVSAGLARHFSLDPALVRIGFVVLTLFGGTGLALYAILWIVLPAEDGVAALGPETSNARKALLITLIVIACISLPFAGVAPR